jgi:hypothetical protein
MKQRKTHQNSSRKSALKNPMPDFLWGLTLLFILLWQDTDLDPLFPGKIHKKPFKVFNGFHPPASQTRQDPEEDAAKLPF